MKLWECGLVLAGVMMLTEADERWHVACSGNAQEWSLAEVHTGRLRSRCAWHKVTLGEVPTVCLAFTIDTEACRNRNVAAGLDANSPTCSADHGCYHEGT